MLWLIRWLIYCKIKGDHYWVDLSLKDDKLVLRCADCGMSYEDYREKMK